MLAPVEDEDRALAERVRSALAAGAWAPAEFRRALLSVPGRERDAWVDRVLGIDGIPDDGPSLPAGCVPYLPCGVDAILRMVEHAEIRAEDVFIDIGSGLGRAAALVQLLTGAEAIGIEVQPELVRRSCVAAVEGDAVDLVESVGAGGDVFLLYCPFSGERLEAVLDALETVAKRKPIRVCCVDLPLPPRSWLTQVPLPYGDLTIYRSGDGAQ